MVKPITSSAAIEAAKNYGHEPILVLKVDWGDDYGIKYYADKSLATPVTTEGTLLEVSAISSTKKRDNVGMVSVVQITLDDTDGLLKVILDRSSLEYREAWLYEHFEGLGTADFTLLFKGNIAGPIEWSESERTLKFELETKLRDLEVGFSADLGSIANLNPDAVDKPWPLCFGNVVHVPALKLKTAAIGHLKYPFKGPRSDGTLPSGDPSEDDTHCYLLTDEGLNFPTGVFEVSIDGVIFRVSRTGDTLTIAEANLPRYANIAFAARPDDDIDSDLPDVAWISSTFSIINCYVYISDAGGNRCFLRVVRQEGSKIWFDQKPIPSPRELIVSQLGGISYKKFGVGDYITEVAKNGRPGWGISEQQSAFSSSGLLGPSINGTGYNSGLQVVQIIARVPWNFQVGTEILVWSPYKTDVFIANLIPSTAVVAVYAKKRDRHGAEHLTAVPVSYFSANTNDTITVANTAGTVTVHPTTITFATPLRYYENQGWSDEIYVTLRSAVGPNTSAIIKWLYDTYSSIDTDTTSFTAVATLINNYPSNFAIFDKQNVITLADEIAWQARCGILTDNGTVFLRYLSSEPASDVDYAETNIKEKSLSLTFTRTEDIVTDFKASYKLTYYPEVRYQKYIYHQDNVDTYGFHRKEYNFYIYNITSLVQKSVDFWAHRYANSWRLAKMRIALEAIKLEIFDCVNLVLSDTTLLNFANIKTIVESTSLDDDEIELLLWLPSVAGTMIVDPGAWLDDSGDTSPGDPTIAYLGLARDIQYADEESQFRAFRATNSPVSPGQVIDVLDQAAAGVPSPANVDSSADPWNVTIYGNGFGAPATTNVVTATPINPDQPPMKDEKVAVVQLNGKNYIINTSKPIVVPAIVINTTATPTLFKVDIYANGYDHDITKANTNAEALSPSGLPAINDKVAVMIIDLVHYYILNTGGSFSFPAELGGSVGAGNYTFFEIDPVSAAAVDGGIADTAHELNGVTVLGAGLRVVISKKGSNYYFSFPAENCS